MKKISGILLLAFVLSFSYAVQAQVKVNEVYLTKSIVVEKTNLADLHNRAYTWVTTYYRTENRIVTAREIDENLVGVDVEVPMKSGATLGYTIRFDLKDNGYTYTISKLSMEENTEVKKYMDDLSTQIKEVMNPALKKVEK
ncbi:MAG: DUF4468 domain-containing protein [Bacteroidales bacterium]|nr:DUF4468 domain-containing protein [Bacteroidales bacterium]MCF8455224.1 DUF4468 domain-containing protein [Bacteroidales bacterium]